MSDERGVIRPFDEGDAPARLSAEGRRRREAMLGELVGELSRTRRRRVVRAQLTAGALAIVLVGLAFMTVSRGPVKIATVTPLIETAPGTVAQATTIAGTRFVKTDPTVVERWAVKGGFEMAKYETRRHEAEPIVRFIGDEELLDTLAAMGRPAGIVRMEGRVWLTAAVTDAERLPAHSPSKGG
ncbi:MAG TPA: hypothetical protein VG797_03335 [Phycisphaerales bacterium]|nr:hypothetical protein [Phycisphaerales bacterium]